MSTQLELKYFDLNGRAGAIRMLLDYLQIPFTDSIIPREKWSLYKASTPFGQVPVLLVENGKFAIPQSTAILRYIATKFGGLAKSPEEQALCDAYAEQIQDFIMAVRPWIWTITRETPNEEKEEKYISVLLPAVQESFVPIFERQLRSNESGWLIGDSVTWIDFFLADIVDKLVHRLKPENVSILENLVKHQKKIFSLPNLEERIKQREKYIF
uniref:Glutathione S-transferase n=1 Tax=Panagrolaimus sp. PS1159 TaxID=55785 RepID=A0AC35GIU0_9BILA